MNATTILWLTSLTLPALIFYAGGISRSVFATWTRTLLAIGCGWIFMVAYAQAAQSLSQEPATNGAALAFASVFGWVLPAIVVSGCLFIRWIIIRHGQRKTAPKFPV